MRNPRPKKTSYNTIILNRFNGPLIENYVLSRQGTGGRSINRPLRSENFSVPGSRVGSGSLRF